jgi:endonuclease G, mitochondrial
VKLRERPGDGSRGILKRIHYLALVLTAFTQFCRSGDFRERYFGDPSLDDLAQNLVAAPETLTILENSGYAVGYDETRKAPRWVTYFVREVKLNKYTRQNNCFKADPRTRANVKPGDFARSGFDRGHIAPAKLIQVVYGEEAGCETFLMSNMAAQYPRLNRGIWKQLEDRENRYALADEKILIVAGPIFSQNGHTIGDTGVVVPIGFYKILVKRDGGRLLSMAFIFDNESDNQGRLSEDNLTSVDEIEAKTGLDFFYRLDEETQKYLESYTAKRIW